MVKIERSRQGASIALVRYVCSAEDAILLVDKEGIVRQDTRER